MVTSDAGTLTLGEAARRLDTTISALLKRIYDGEVPARPNREYTRLVMDEDEVERMVRLQAEHRT